MTDIEQIKEALKRLTKSGAATIQAVAKSVNYDDMTITVEIGELILDDVRLRSIVDDDNGFIVVPAADSIVTLLRLGNSDDYVCIYCEKFEKVLIKLDDVSMEINKDGVIFNGNALGSFMTNINELVSKLNGIENKVNSLISTYNSHTHTVATTGTAAAQTGTAAATTNVEAGTLQNTTINDLKDDKIKH